MLFKRNFKTILFMTLVFMMLVGFSGMLLAMGREHPNKHPAEHPKEHPKGSGHLDKDELADAVAEHVAEEAAKHGGFFIVNDDKTGKELKLRLHKVHRDRLSKVGKDEYFACADFMSTTGKMYDLDVFMKGTSRDNLRFEKFSVHKVEGKERYTWYQQGGVWKKKYAESSGDEHPEGEHPEDEHPG